MSEVPTSELPQPTQPPAESGTPNHVRIGNVVEGYFGNPSEKIDKKLEDFARGREPIALAEKIASFEGTSPADELVRADLNVIPVDLNELASFLKSQDPNMNIHKELPGENMAFNFITGKDGKLVPVIAAANLSTDELSGLYEEQGEAAREARGSLVVREQQIKDQQQKNEVKKQEEEVKKQAKALIATLSSQVSDRLRFLGKRINSETIQRDVYLALQAQGTLDKQTIEATVEEVSNRYADMEAAA